MANQNPGKTFVNVVLNNDIVQICAIFLVAAACLKGCDLLDEIDTKTKTFEGAAPDCNLNQQANIKIDGKEYTLVCK